MNKKGTGWVLIFFLSCLYLYAATSPAYAETYNLSLPAGENLISLPLTPEDTAIGTVLSPIVSRVKDVWSYQVENSDNPWKHYRPNLDDYSNLKLMEPGRGYWLDLKYGTTLQISGSIVPDEATLYLWKGWNLIGWPYLYSEPIVEAFSGLIFGRDYSKITSFDNAAKTLEYFYNQPASDDFSSFEPGKAYYIYMLKDKTIGISIPGPDIPQNIDVSAEGAAVTLQWDTVINPSLAGYNVYRSQDPSGPYTQINSNLISSGFYTDSVLEEGKQYYYQITAVDIYGNESSYSLIAYRFSATTIGSEGGEVFSADRRVQAIIPPGALSSPTEITILSPIEQYLVNSVPEGQALLAAAEFKPYGLQFNKLIQVIYTLPRTEVPGTEVELGLYNSQTNEINPTGQVSTVGSDGYRVEFSIDHFSTYAALKGLFSQGGAPIGSGVDIPLPDMFTGSFSHSIPLTIPPGRQKMQPNLALTYRSSNPNSWLGVGFNLNPGYIVRSTRLGPPTYNDEQDTFYFINTAGSTELVHLTDNLYQAKIESSFTKFFKEGDSWRVVEKSGMVLYLGQSPDSKETASGGTFSWYLTKAVDTNRNFVEYNYTKDQGKPYLNYIDYTGNENVSISAPNRVEFNLESRSDVSSSYISGSQITVARRLAEIKVKQNGELIWRYELGYQYSSDTERSLLKSVTQYGADGAALPTQEFTYQVN